MTTATGVERVSQGSWSARLQAGLLAGLMATIFSISHATLVTGAVAPQATSAVIGMALIGTTVLCLTFGLVSGVKGCIPIVQDVPSAALGAILVTLVASRAAEASVPVSVADVVVLCLVAGLTTSLALIVFGMLRLSSVMRYTPRPVLAGFLAGTGYFVAMGAVGICLGDVVTLVNVPDLFAGMVFVKFATAALVAAALFLANAYTSANLALGGVFITSFLLFHAVAFLTGFSTEQMAATGWTATLPAEGMVWPPIGLDDLKSADYSFVLSQIFPLCTMIILATAALLMNTSALEAKTRRDVPMDRELKVLGLSNLAASALGGLPGYHGISASLAAMRIAPPHRLTTLLAGVFVLLVYLSGDTVLALLPLPIFAGAMLWLGLGFLYEWVVQEFRITPPSEAWLTVAILLIIVTVGLFEGTVFGLVAGGMLFIVNYSRMDPIRAEYSGDVLHGATEHTQTEHAVLDAHGNAIVVLKMQGYIFFGTAYHLRERIRNMLRDRPIRYVLLDFEAVTGIDATAVGRFERIAEDLENAAVQATLAGMTPKVSTVFNRAGLDVGPAGRFASAADLNAGLTIYEARLLQDHVPGGAQRPDSIQAILTEILRDPDLATQMVPYLERIDLPADTAFVTKGDMTREIFILEKGEASVIVGHASSARRLRSLGPGSIIGEIAYYQGGARTTTVRTTEPSVVWRFSPDLSEELLVRDPTLSSHFHSGLARSLAERVAANTRLIQMLQA